jgi:hypothetical protein
METYSFHVVVQVEGQSWKMLHLRDTVLTEKEKTMKVGERWWGRRRVKGENTKKVVF